MSANECELLLSKIIDIIIRYENQIEDVRIQLAKNQYFFPSPSFKRIAIDGKGYLREEDLEGFLRHYGLSVNDKELRRFFISDQEKSAVMSYNSFLDQVLPSTDLELRTKCLERKTKDLETVSQVLLADVDRLIVSIYQKEIELFRALKGNINRFIEFDIELIEFIFSMLADDNSGYLTFKSLLSFMKKNGYAFDKRGYESLMKRIDKKAKGRINHVELKFFLLSNEAFQEPNQSFSYVERSINHSKSIFDNLSPIKSTKGSPQKNNLNSNEVKIPSNETVATKEKSKSPAKRTRNERSPEIRIPEEPLKTFSTNYEQPASFEDRFNKSKSVNQSRAEFNNNYPHNPMEHRHLDPVYNSYWAYHRDHNRTLSPEYFHKIRSQNLLDSFRKNTFLSSTGKNHHYFNPAYVESSASDFQRFPYNPFRYTDHEHYFQGYYGNLRNNYYERYYHHTPYIEKVTLANPSKRLDTAKASPIKIKNAPPNVVPSHRRFESRHIHLQSVTSEPQLAAYQHYQGPSYATTKRSTGNLHHYDLANPLDERLQSIQDQSAPLPPVYQDHKTAKLKLDDFLYQRPGQNLEVPRNPQPYSYVVKDA